jgi:hypothetical protein
MKSNKLIFIFLIILLFSGITISVISYFHIPEIKHNVQSARSIVRIISVLVLLAFSTLIRSKYFITICICFLLSILGGMFKVSHWPFADIILAAPASVTLILYIIHYVNKPTKNILDILKLFYVTFICGVIFSVLLPSVCGFCVRKIEDILFHILFIIFTIQFYKQYVKTTSQ